jgi:hypothetical protein
VITTAAFWKASAERAIKTFLQTYLAVFLVGDQMLNVFTFEWGGASLGVALGATLLSFATSLLSSSVGNSGPSLANEVAVVPDHHRTNPNV